ncbi:MAG TPA: kinase/pyrophosphorylase [Propionibacteriaceae bacterium]|nr:kinase/pyrophosphorylase [Propionibacteriaceae bacterium]
MKPNNGALRSVRAVGASDPGKDPSLAELRHHESLPADRPAVPVFFLSDSTGISAETMGNALLIQFPFLRFERRLIPFINSLEEARKVVAILDAAMNGPVTPLAFTTAADCLTAHCAISATPC